MYESLKVDLQKAARGSSQVSDQIYSPGTRMFRSSRRPTPSDRVRFQLVDVDGILEWEETQGCLPELGPTRRGRSGASTTEGVVLQMEFDRLPPSQITQFLTERDKKLTPKQGLRVYDSDTKHLVPVTEVPKTGSALVLVHGTFSNGDNLLNGFQYTQAGSAFLDQAIKVYGTGRVFSFDHPTLSVGPLLNAIDLHRRFQGSKVKLDLICHSRGGLIARWLCDVIDPNADRCRKALLVGSPLAGTGLAAPPNIKKTINLFTRLANVAGRLAGLGAFGVPLLAVVECLLRVVSSITTFAAKTPAVDAVMAMVPGLFAMSRVGNNPELLRLLDNVHSDATRYFAIQSNFEPEDPTWKFWRMLRKDRVRHAMADAIFDGKNDLVVDTSSMNQLSTNGKLKVPQKQTYDFRKSETVHHLNYFHQQETIDFLSDMLLK